VNRVWACKWVISRINYCMLQTINIIFVISVIIIVINKTLLKINLYNNTNTVVPYSRFQDITVTFQWISTLFTTNHQQSEKEELKQLFKLAPYPMQFSSPKHLFANCCTNSFPWIWAVQFHMILLLHLHNEQLLAVHLVLDYNQHGKITLYTIRPWGLLISTAVTKLHRKILMDKSANTVPRK
jgi:hypothetical protein